MTHPLPRVAMLGLAVLAAIGAVDVASLLVAQAANTDGPWLWWATRAFGFAAYLAMSLSMLFGVMVTARGLDGFVARKTVLYLHQQWTLAAVVSTLLHVATVVVHAESHISLIGAIVPFATSTLTGPVALGVVGMWGLLVLAVSSWLRSRIPYGAWRVIHAFAFGAFLLSALHGVTAGTDSAQPLVQWAYLAITATVAGSILFRILTAVGGAPRKARGPRAATAIRPDQDGRAVHITGTASRSTN